MAAPATMRNRLAAPVPQLPTMAAPATPALTALGEEDQGRTLGEGVPDRTLPAPVHLALHRIRRAGEVPPARALRRVRLLQRFPAVGAEAVGDGRSNVNLPVGSITASQHAESSENISHGTALPRACFYEKIIPA